MKKKNILAIIGITILSIGLIGCGNSTSAANTKNESNWEVSKTLDISHKNNIGGFYNDNFGITVGYSGEIHYTNDGGATWPRSTNTSMCRFGLDIVSEKIAWCCGNGGHIRKSLDGGQNWVAVKDFGGSLPNQCRYISFLDDKKGWVASPKLLGATIDGGETWTEITLPSGIGKILSMNLLNEKIGFLVDSNSKLYTTIDGGATWETKDVKTTDMSTMVWDTNTTLLKFTDDKNGTFFYGNNDVKIKCIKTTDGGATWNEELLPDVKRGALYLSHDGKILSINTDQGNKITLLNHK
jgi:photosystem II stability/assembly factor-like uncharacterized protein